MSDYIFIGSVQRGGDEKFDGLRRYTLAEEVENGKKELSVHGLVLEESTKYWYWYQYSVLRVVLL